MMLLHQSKQSMMVHCFAAASRFTRPTTLLSNKSSSFQLHIRGGSGSPQHNSRSSDRLHVKRTGASSSTSRCLSMVDSVLQEKAAESRSIAGPIATKSFGGLSFCEPSDAYRVVFVLGGPGAGKGTQSDLLLKNYPCAHFSAGELLRDETNNPDSKHAALIEKCLVEGSIVPVEITLSLLENAMKSAPGKQLIMLVDGFPRNFDNLAGWTDFMSDVANVNGVLFYKCPLAVLEARILERAKSSGRSDDNMESLRRRFKTFEDETCPVIESLRLVGGDDASLQVFDIDGNQALPVVWERTQNVVNSLLADDVLASNAKLLDAVAANDSEAYQSVCHKAMFGESSVAEIMTAQESNKEFPTVNVENASLTFISGTKVRVSYDRKGKTVDYKETRIWSHDDEGWRNIHFVRFPTS